MNLSNSKVTVGINTRAVPANPGVSGSVQVGFSNLTLTLAAASRAMSFEALLVGANPLAIEPVAWGRDDISTWTAGAQQVETATAAGTITAPGNAAVVVTAAGMTGSPKTLAVAVANGDTAAVWAGKVRAALAADADVAEMFSVGGTGTAIALTRKVRGSFTVNGAAVNVCHANDGTLNIALDNGTCTGITTAASSANTTTGVATDGVYAPAVTGEDGFGNEFTAAGDDLGFLVRNDPTSGSLLVSKGTEIVDMELPAGGVMLLACASASGGWLSGVGSLEPQSGTGMCKVYVTMISA